MSGQPADVDSHLRHVLHKASFDFIRHPFKRFCNITKTQKDSALLEKGTLKEAGHQCMKSDQKSHIQAGASVVKVSSASLLSASLQSQESKLSRRSIRHAERKKIRMLKRFLSQIEKDSLYYDPLSKTSSQSAPVTETHRKLHLSQEEQIVGSIGAKLTWLIHNTSKKATRPSLKRRNAYGEIVDALPTGGSYSSDLNYECFSGLRSYHMLPRRQFSTRLHPLSQVVSICDLQR